jgi:hypothetical protein
MFKVHSYFLTTQSQVFSDMFGAPRVDSSSDGTEFNPLVLSNDTVQGWELLLSAIYPRSETVFCDYCHQSPNRPHRLTGHSYF